MASWAVARECGKRMEMEQLFVGEVLPLTRPDFIDAFDADNARSTSFGHLKPRVGAFDGRSRGVRMLLYGRPSVQAIKSMNLGRCQFIQFGMRFAISRAAQNDTVRPKVQKGELLAVRCFDTV